jgi:hypothetical protein
MPKEKVLIVGLGEVDHSMFELSKENETLLRVDKSARSDKQGANYTRSVHSSNVCGYSS